MDYWNISIFAGMPMEKADNANIITTVNPIRVGLSAELYSPSHNNRHPNPQD